MEKKNNYRTYAIIGLVLLGFRLMIFGVDFVENRETLTVSYEEYAKERPKNNNLEITDSKIELANAIYLENQYASGKKKPDAFFIPIQSTASFSLDEETKLMLRVTEGEIYDKILGLFEKDETELAMEFLQNPEDYTVKGPFQGYYYNSDEISDELHTAAGSPSSYITVISAGEGFPYGVVGVLLAIWLGLLFYVIKAGK